MTDAIDRTSRLREHAGRCFICEKGVDGRFDGLCPEGLVIVALETRLAHGDELLADARAENLRLREEAESVTSDYAEGCDAFRRGKVRVGSAAYVLGWDVAAREHEMRIRRSTRRLSLRRAKQMAGGVAGLVRFMGGLAAGVIGMQRRGEE